MTTTFLYKVHPADASTYIDVKGEMTPIMIVLAVSNGINVFIGIFLLFTGGWLISVGVFFTLVFILLQMQKVADEEARNKKAKEESEIYSAQLNSILIKSEEIIAKILPHFEALAEKNIEIAKIDFSENAISPFWDKIEEASKSLALYKEAVDQLQINGEIYSRVLENRSHNFPVPFPFGTNLIISHKILIDFNATVRKAQSKFEFANIWEHRKTQKILIAGFATLEQAINNMADRIVTAISELNHSIKSEFRELKNIQIEQIKSFEAGNRTLNNTLTSMDTKLYFMQYKEKPITPFVRPLSDHLG
jgi:hypothetical protein